MALEVDRLPIKVALIINPTDNSDGKRCLETVGNSVTTGWPGSAAAVFESASTLFDTPPMNVASEVQAALREGVSFGLFSFGGQGQGKTTALWGSPALGPEEAIVPRFCADLFSILESCKEGGGGEVVVAVSFLRVSGAGGNGQRLFGSRREGERAGHAPARGGESGGGEGLMVVGVVDDIG